MRRAPLLLAAGLLAVPVITGCGSSTPSCSDVARDVNTQVAALRAAIGRSADDPADAATALRRMQQHLDDIAGRTSDDPAATKAVGDLALAVSNAKNDLDGHVAHPDITPITRAAAALSSACPTKG